MRVARGQVVPAEAATAEAWRMLLCEQPAMWNNAFGLGGRAWARLLQPHYQ